MDPAGSAWTSVAGNFPSDITILRVKSTPRFLDGTRARAQTGVYTHHIAFVDITSKPLEVTRCVNSDTETPRRMSIITGVAEEAGSGNYTIPLPGMKSGYYIKKNSPILLTGDLVNYTDAEKEVYIEVELDYVEGRDPKLLETSVQVLRLAECSGKDQYIVVDIPEGKNKFTLSSKVNKIMQNGYIFDGSKWEYQT
jgi:hypothetical protein